MKRFITLIASSAVLFAAANTFAATQTATLGVGATVPQRCSISAGNLNFNVQAASTSDTTTTGQISVSCQGTTSYSIGIDDGRNQSSTTPATVTGNTYPAGDRNLADSRGNRIPYDVYHDSAFQNRWGHTSSSSTSTGDRASATNSGGNFTVYAKIPAAPNAEPGTYSDQLTVTLYY